MEYDEAYDKTKAYFGSEPTAVLKKYYHLIDKDNPVLDIGIGQGRNAIFLSRNGYEVDGIDPSKVAVNTISAIARKENLPIRTYHCGFEDFNSPVDRYSAVLIFGLIQFQSWKVIDLLLQKVKTWTTKGSLVFVTAFSTEDPAFRQYSKEWKKIGKNSFSDEDGRVATHLEPGEILKLFKDYSVIHHWEGLGSKHRHGDDPIEQHWVVEAVFRR
jgi:tellurite methyltransferase